jgi:hypothetical protein
VRRTAAFLAATLCLLAACGSDGSDKAGGGGTTTLATTPSSTVVTTTSTSVPVTSTTVACHGIGSTQPVTTATAANAALLRAVRVTGERCADRVVFDFTTETNAAPRCTIAYAQPPFTMDGSGAPVTVEGSAFVSVRCEPAYGYDFSSGQPTYTGPKRIAATGTRHVRELVETGDFEGVLNWVIGLDAQQPFAASTTTVAGPQARNRLLIRFF